MCLQPAHDWVNLIKFEGLVFFNPGIFHRDGLPPLGLDRLLASAIPLLRAEWSYSHVDTDFAFKIFVFVMQLAENVKQLPTAVPGQF